MRTENTPNPVHRKTAKSQPPRKKKDQSRGDQRRETSPAHQQRKPSRKSATPFQRRLLYLVLILTVITAAIFWIVEQFQRSVILQQPDRVNLVVYGQIPTFYSFGIRDVGNYAIPFYPDLRVQVPDGYGLYRLGALGKLISLEKKPKLLQKAFSGITSTFIDFYFLEGSEEIYYGGGEETTIPAKPGIKEVLFMQTNASFLDKIYILALLNDIQPNSVKEVRYLPFQNDREDMIFNADRFLDSYIGTFYQKTYRKENINVQIIYTKSYVTADYISSVLNGNGIVVGDVSKRRKEYKNCTILTKETYMKSLTINRIRQYFGCDVKTGETGLYDAVFVLANIENDWYIKDIP